MLGWSGDLSTCLSNVLQDSSELSNKCEALCCFPEFDLAQFSVDPFALFASSGDVALFSGSFVLLCDWQSSSSAFVFLRTEAIISEIENSFDVDVALREYRAKVFWPLRFPPCHFDSILKLG